MAENYGVAQPQISNDMKVLKSFIEENIGKDIKAITDSLFRAAVTKAIKDNEYKDAITFIEKWNNWLWNIGAVDKTPQKIEINQSNAIIDEIIKEIKEENASEPPKGKD